MFLFQFEDGSNKHTVHLVCASSPQSRDNRRKDHSQVRFVVKNVCQCFGSGTPRPKTISARTFWPIFQSGTPQPTLVGLLGPFYLFIFGGGVNVLFYSVYVHQNKIQETLFNVILIFLDREIGK